MIVTKKRAISIISPGPFIKYITPVAMPQPAIHIKNSKKQGFTLLQRNKRSKPLPISLNGLGMGETLLLWHVGIHFL